MESKSYEIDLIALSQVLWSNKWLIAKFVIVFFILGLIIGYTSPKEYQTSCSLISESMGAKNKLGGSLGGLASIAGIDIGGISGGINTINPELYERVATSTPFLLTLLSQEYYFPTIDRNITIREYYGNYHEQNLIGSLIKMPFKLFKIFESKVSESMVNIDSGSIVTISREDQKMMDDLMGRIKVSLENSMEIVRIEVKMQDPLVAAQLTEYTKTYITQYVKSYTTNKTEEQLEFVNKQFNEKEITFYAVQERLALFRDRNRNVNTAQARSYEERLQSEYNLAFNLYNQLAQQRESIKLQLNEMRPVFTVLEPVKVPVNKNSPKRMLILLVCIIIGVFFSIAFIGIQIVFKTSIKPKIG